MFVEVVESRSRDPEGVEGGAVWVSTLTMVDLAGSERMAKTVRQLNFLISREKTIRKSNVAIQPGDHSRYRCARDSSTMNLIPAAGILVLGMCKAEMTCGQLGSMVVQNLGQTSSRPNCPIPSAGGKSAARNFDPGGLLAGCGGPAGEGGRVHQQEPAHPGHRHQQAQRGCPGHRRACALYLVLQHTAIINDHAVPNFLRGQASGIFPP